MKRHYIHGKGKDKGKDAKADGMIVVGMFMNSNEDGTPYFCYTVLDKMPEGNFVRYSSQSGEEPEFTNDIDGHGYIYMKVIRVRDQQV
jgi:hypothetical protein